MTSVGPMVRGFYSHGIMSLRVGDRLESLTDAFLFLC